MLNCFFIHILCVSFFVFFTSCGFFQNSFSSGDVSYLSTEKAGEEEKEEGNNNGATSASDSNNSLPASDFATSKKKADILFIVDTSYSMVKHLQSTDKTFKNFVPYLSSIAWKIAFTNADYNFDSFSYYGRDLFNGKAMKLELNGNILPFRFLYPYVENNSKIFLDTLKRYENGDIDYISPDQYINPCDLPPYCQSNIRSPIGSLINSLFVNKSFLRKKSAFVAVIFTNGDDVHVTDSSANLFIHQFREKYGLEKKIAIYSISIFPGDEDCYNKNKEQQYNFAEVAYSKNIHQFVRVTKGGALSICELDYSPLAKIITQFL